MNLRESNSIERGNKVLVRILLVLFLIGVSLCIHDINYKKPDTDVIQPELSEKEFIELVNNILVEKVSLKMFDKSYGQYTYIRNTYDCNEIKIKISISRTATEVHISISPGHFRGETYVHPQMIDTKCLFTHQIESQVDVTPTSSFKKKRTNLIEIMGYKGTMNVSRGHVSIYFGNIGELTPTPTHPDPTGTAIYYVYAGFIVIILGIVVLVIYIIKRRRKS
ncbi:MAG: hypothetical protein PVF58_07670 [Candidatus Methanofastidiosia archaeon]